MRVGFRLQFTSYYLGKRYKFVGQGKRSVLELMRSEFVSRIPEHVYPNKNSEKRLLTQDDIVEKMCATKCTIESNQRIMSAEFLRRRCIARTLMRN